jgi:CSLREA domain-containing protein
MTRIGVLRMEKPLASKALVYGLAATLMTLILLLVAKPAHAATFFVNSTGDAADQSTADGNCDTGSLVGEPRPGGIFVLVPECTLRAAIQQANASSMAGVTNVIDATGVTGTINLGSDLPELTTDMNINGPGASQLTVQGNSTSFDIFTIGSRGNISAHFNSVSISGLTASGGKALTQDGGGIFNAQNTTLTLDDVVVSNNAASNSGGGIANFGTLTITDSTVSTNTAGQSGGGINSSGTLTITGSTIKGNTALNGGGIGSGSATGDAALTMTNSTISGNTGTSVGGGLSNGEGTATLTNVTINGNTAGIEANVRNFGPPAGNTEITFKNTIVANPQGGGTNCGTNADGLLTSAGHNLSSDASCGFTQTADIQNQNPLLGNLTNNGGPTETHELQAGSLAIDAADTASAPSEDQRGIPRPQGVAADIGAFEVKQAPIVVEAKPTGKKVFPKANMTARFSEVMDEASVEATDPVTLKPTTFTLKKKGSATTLSATVNYDSNTKTATLDPAKKLRRGTTYIATVTTAAEDLAGTALDQDPNTIGDQPKIWTFRVRR